METVNYRGVVPLEPLEPLAPLAPLELVPPWDELEPGRCEDDPLGDVLLLPGVVLELPLVLRLPPSVELPDVPELPLMPLCELLVPGAPTLLLDPLWFCCIAIVRVSDSTICSKRATRASIEPEPLTLLPPLSVPLLLELPSVPEPPTDEDWPRPPLDCEVVPDCPIVPELDVPELPIEPCREEDVPDWPDCPAPLAPIELDPLDPLEPLAPLDPIVPLCEPELDEPGVLLDCCA